MLHHIRHPRRLLLTIAFLFAAASSTSLYLQQMSSGAAAVSLAIIQPSDVYTTFTNEVRAKIKSTYWEEITNERLDELFHLAAEKVKKEGITDKKEATVRTAALVLANLKPFGRSQLLTEKVKKQLVETVSNIDTTKDLYKDLGLEKGASLEEVKKAFETQPKTEKTEYAHKVLTDAHSKKQYDTNGAEPTIFVTNPAPGIAYLKLTNIAPQTLQEFPKTLEALGKIKAQAMIIDLRGNIGGVIDMLQYALGPFIGPDQYAYDFFHKGEKIPYKTKTTWAPELQQYKQIVVLTDNTVQSSAEVMTATFKKYGVGVVVGTNTKGWGTIEKLVQMRHQLDEKEKYSLLIVEDLTLRDNDQQPIEGKGVDPDIRITDKNWKQQLGSYYHNAALTAAVEQIWNNPPAFAN